MPDSNPYSSGTLTVAKGTTLAPLKTATPVVLDDKGKIGTAQIDPKTIEQMKQGGEETKPAQPEPDERLKAFFRVKIGGMSAPVDPTQPGPGLPQPTATPTPPPAPGATPAAPATKTTTTTATPAAAGKTTSPTTTPAPKTTATSTTAAPKQPPKTTPAPNPLAPEAVKFDQSVKIAPTDFGKDPALDFSKVGTGGKIDEATLQQFQKPVTPAEVPPDTPREMIFDSAKGDFLGRPFIRLSSYQHATCKFILNDPDDSIRPLISKLQNVEAELGFENGYKLNKFVGVIYTIGRRLPGGTEVEAVDSSYQLQGAASAVTSTTAVTPPPPGTANPTTDGRTVTSTFEGQASFYGGGDGFDGNKTANGEIFDTNKLTAAHRTLPFGTEVRVTNVATGKSVIVRINDRGPYSKGRVIDLSKAAATEIGMVAAGHANIKGEVLGKAAAPTPISTPTATPKPTTSTPPTTPPTPLSPTVPTTPTPPKTTPPAPTAPPPPAAAPTDDPLGLQTTPPPSTNGTRKASLAELYVKDTNLKFVDNSPVKIQKEGEVALQQSAMAAIELEAAMKGDVVIASGNTVTSVSPGQGEPTGVTLDYKENRSVFIGPLTVTKRMPVHLQSGFGSVTVQSWNPTEKTMVGATVSTPAPVIQHPTGVIQAPAWGSIKLSDPIIPGSPYTWGDATKNGSRVPSSKEIMQRIVRICQIITPMTKETGVPKWTINSWYRDPISNRKVGGAKDSRHTYGDGVDFFFSGSEYVKLFQKLWADGPSGSGGWAGGVAKGNGFIHIDNRDAEGRGRSRWYYKGAK